VLVLDNNDKVKTPFNRRIKEIRLSLGLTQEKFADLAGISRISVAGYETTNKTPDINTFIKIATNLNINPMWLIGLSDDRNSHTNIHSQCEMTDIQQVISLNLRKPMWFRIKEPDTGGDIGWKIYRLDSDKHIELFDPFEERNSSGDERIYLNLLNCTNFLNTSDWYKSIYIFMSRYGFFGNVMHILGGANEKKLMDLIYEHNRGMRIDNYITADNISITDLEDFLKSNSIFIINDNEKIPCNYYESPADVAIEAFSFKTILDKLPNGIFTDVENYLHGNPVSEMLNPKLADIMTLYNNYNGKLTQTFAYRSLTSLMYYEFAFDISHNRYPRQCKKCLSYFIERSSEHDTCKKCLNRDKDE
jgi:transcriptional regulator with XRE-family HTH domain